MRDQMPDLVVDLELACGKTFFRFIKTFERMVSFYGRQLNGTIRASLWSGQRRIANSGVIAHFNQEYVKTGVFEKGASKIIRNASELREQADYEDFYEATQEEASNVFMQASQFILEVECYTDLFCPVLRPNRPASSHIYAVHQIWQCQRLCYIISGREGNRS